MVEKFIVGVTLLCGLLWLSAWLIQRFSPKLIDPSGITYSIIDFGRSLFPILLIVLVLRSFVAENFIIPSGSMKPSLLEGDLVLVTKYNYGLRLPIIGQRLVGSATPKRGDIVVFRSSVLEKNVIKRIIGLPGDKIDYYNGNLLINGHLIPQEYVRQTVDVDVNGHGAWVVNEKNEKLNGTQHKIYQRDPSLPDQIFTYNHVVVPEGSYFVMGDNRDYSKDSRFIGFIPDKDVLGRAYAIWLSWDMNASWTKPLSKVRWDRMFNRVDRTV